MAKKKSQSYTRHFIAGLAIGVGIYLAVVGVLGDMSQNWQAFYIALGLGLLSAGSIGVAKLK